MFSHQAKVQIEAKKSEKIRKETELRALREKLRGLQRQQADTERQSGSLNYSVGVKTSALVQKNVDFLEAKQSYDTEQATLNRLRAGWDNPAGLRMYFPQQEQKVSLAKSRYERIKREYEQADIEVNELNKKVKRASKDGATLYQQIAVTEGDVARVENEIVQIARDQDSYQAVYDGLMGNRRYI